MGKALAHRPAWNLAWRPAAGNLPNGPVTLWMAVFSDDHRLMGAAPMTGQPAWIWRDGQVAIDYGTVVVEVLQPGRYADAVIVAVASGRYQPVFRIGLGEGRDMRAGWTITIRDGAMAFHPVPENAVR
jgi:hypothetical protein